MNTAKFIQAKEVISPLLGTEKCHNEINEKAHGHQTAQPVKHAHGALLMDT
jgi:hypothetical protein